MTPLKHCSAALALFLLVSPLTAQPLPDTAENRRLLSATSDWLIEAAKFDTFEARIPTRDEKELAADVYVPRRGGAFPVVLIQTPYDKNAIRPWFQGVGRWGADSLLTDDAYAFVVVDRRGRFGSRAALPRGANAELLLAPDGYDTVEWIARQEWSNGRVAGWGASALARAQFETARAHPPHLVCSVPIVAPLYIGYDTYFPGGVLWEEFVTRLGALGWNLRDTLVRQPAKAGLWIEIERARRPDPREIQVPMLWIAGWYDLYINEMIQDFVSVRTSGDPAWRQRQHLVIGPWTHFTADEEVGALRFPAAHHHDMQRTRAFLDHCLRSADNDYAHEPPAIEYFVMHDSWKSARSWPPAEAGETSLYLGVAASGERVLGAALQPEGEPASTFRFDPADPVPTVGGHVLTRDLEPGPQDQRAEVESRDDTLEFSSEVLEQSLTIAGAPHVELSVSSDGPDTDFTAILTDVYPDGRSILVGEGIERLRFRETTAEERLGKPGQIYPITIALPNTAIVVQAGHRLRLIVSSSSYPRFAVNKNDGGPMYGSGEGRIATNTIHHDTTHPSVLVLPILSGSL